MPKPFSESFKEWVRDARYEIGEDVGWEYMDNKEAGPTPADSSSALNNVSKNPEQKVLD